MKKMTTVKVSVATRDELKALAARSGLTLEEQLVELLKSERRRLIGSQISSQPLTAEETMILDASAADVLNEVR